MPRKPLLVCPFDTARQLICSRFNSKGRTERAAGTRILFAGNHYLTYISSDDTELHERLADTFSTIEEVRVLCKAPSISVGLIHEGRIVLRRSWGYRDVERRLEPDGDTIYRLASCTKMITTTIIGQLVDEGRISWQDLISKHVPDFDPTGDPTIRLEAQILDACRHSTGLGNPNHAMYGPHGVIVGSGDTHVQLINACPTSSVKTGQRFRSWWFYSNAAFGLLAHIIENVTGSAFADVVKARLLEPLNMSQTMLSYQSYSDNDNVAHGYVQKGRDSTKWTMIPNPLPCDGYSALLSCMGVASSVNDMLKFCAAVIDRYDTEKQQCEAETEELKKIVKVNPLRQVCASWDTFWTRPFEDGFSNNTAYALGWYETTIPSGALGLFSYNYRRFQNVKDNVMPYIIGKGSTPARKVHGHNGITNGGVATVYVLPESRSAVVAFANAADAGDAAEITAQILLQALFDLQPKIDLLKPLQEEIARTHHERVKMDEDWQTNRNISQPHGPLSDYIGSYKGLGVLEITITASKLSRTLSITFAGREETRCELEHYNVDAFSYLPNSHEQSIASGMIDWDYYTVGICRFIRETREPPAGPVTGFLWQWDQYEQASLFEKQGLSVSYTANATALVPDTGITAPESAHEVTEKPQFKALFKSLERCAVM